MLVSDDKKGAYFFLAILQFWLSLLFCHAALKQQFYIRSQSFHPEIVITIVNRLGRVPDPQQHEGSGAIH